MSQNWYPYDWYPSVIHGIDAQLMDTATCGFVALHERLIMQSDYFHTNTVYYNIYMYTY